MNRKNLWAFSFLVNLLLTTGCQSLANVSSNQQNNCPVEIIEVKKSCV